MLVKTLLALCSSALVAEAAYSATPSATATAAPASYTLKAENITAVFTPYGARLTHLLVPDRNGDMQDVAVGYDKTEQYVNDTETNHSYFGAVVGRYANRIKNGTFTIDGVTSHIDENENGGADTLHGGFAGYDTKTWTVTSSTNDSVTFTLADPGTEGFPGSVITHATYTVSSTTEGSYWGVAHPRMTMKMVSVALDKPTPIMLSNHIYWNLNAFKADTVLNDTTLFMPYSDRYIKIDNIEVPTGEIGTVASKSALDFTKPKTFGKDLADTVNNCGLGCTGYDNAFIVDRPYGTGESASNFPVLSSWSDTTGIRMDVSTNQRGLQIYSCNGQNGTIAVKESQVDRNKDAEDGGAKYVEKYGCFVVETQQWIDDVNHPEWGQTYNYWLFDTSAYPAVNFATYDFSTF